MEIYTFFRMGGSLDRIVIIPVDIDYHEMDDVVEKFDANKCHCFLETDRQRLLAVVETGFGNLRRFGHTVKSSLRRCKRMTMSGRKVAPELTPSGKNLVRT